MNSWMRTSYVGLPATLDLDSLLLFPLRLVSLWPVLPVSSPLCAANGHNHGPAAYASQQLENQSLII